MALTKTAAHHLKHALGNEALSNEASAIIANPAQKPSAQLSDALKHMLASEVHSKEVLAAIVSGAPLSLEAKRRIIHGMGSLEHGNALIAQLSPASTPLAGL